MATIYLSPMMTDKEAAALLGACDFVEAGGGIDGESTAARLARERAAGKVASTLRAARAKQAAKGRPAHA